MKSRNSIVNFLLVVAFLSMIFQTGCSTTGQKPTLSPIAAEMGRSESTEAHRLPAHSSVKPGTGLSEISDPNQLPDFRDEYGKIMLLYAIDNSKLYFNKVQSYPSTFQSMGFTPAKQKESLEFFRDGYLQCKNSQELNEFITKNFRIFQAVSKGSSGDVHFGGYGTPMNDARVTETWTYVLSNGSFGVPLSKMRSIATGSGLFPPGGLAFAVLEKGSGQGRKSFFVLNQDTRGTINSADRADIFFGVGDDAIEKAGSINTKGKLYYLLKR
ncbi:MAG: hypothetical protein D8M57_14425 [Candidatus Scalindua sp. AMX11]|nr:MAG: hypothetical protein DWQ00_09680 [Candidatus Scalindua sp.]NOG82370.1 hypothetical protein [Planctomycetota bacterium]RZV70573.1 MAG: hypothetical protein EX341_15320 [Candidatus Scalindua sp. SCAELEC01]TDE64196.1 MAG: hypothetical protein D8M57_14425 [Candidatus Scalindua sp. AMX11]